MRSKLQLSKSRVTSGAAVTLNSSHTVDIDNGGSVTMTNAADGGRKYNSSRAKVAWMSATEGAHRARNDYDQIR